MTFFLHQECVSKLGLAVNFVDLSNRVFVRPFPQLGTFLSYFPQDFFYLYFSIPAFQENVHQFLANLLFDFYDGHETNNVSLTDFYTWGSFELTSYYSQE